MEDNRSPGGKLVALATHCLTCFYLQEACFFFLGGGLVSLDRIEKCDLHLEPEVV